MTRHLMGHSGQACRADQEDPISCNFDNNDQHYGFACYYGNGGKGANERNGDGSNGNRLYSYTKSDAKYYRAAHWSSKYTTVSPSRNDLNYTNNSKVSDIFSLNNYHSNTVGDSDDLELFYDIVIPNELH